MMVWGCMSSYGMGSFCITKTNLKSCDYIEILKSYCMTMFTDINPEL